jgi:hypothetical protein
LPTVAALIGLGASIIGRANKASFIQHDSYEHLEKIWGSFTAYSPRASSLNLYPLKQQMKFVPKGISATPYYVGEKVAAIGLDMSNLVSLD